MSKKNNKIENSIEEIILIEKKYSHSLFSIDYESILKKTIKIVNEEKEKTEETYIKEYLDNYISFLFNICCKLDKKNIKEYIKLLKKYKIYQYQLKNSNKFFMKYFLSLYIAIYMYKNKKYTYFRKRLIPTMSNNMKKRTKLLFEKKLTFLDKLKSLLPNKLYVDYFELVITTRCTLRCKNCANLMPMYQKNYNVDKDIVLKSINKIKACVDKVCLFRVLGGEPFCNPELKYYLKELTPDKFCEVAIVTNGTLVPKDKELIEIMKRENILVKISDYGKFSYKKEELIELLKKHKIRYKVEDIGKVWYDYGNLEKKNRDEKTLNKQFLNCNVSCKSILNGAIYSCPRQAHGIDLKKINIKSGEYVDLINNSDKENKKQIKKLMFRNNYIEACKYCNFGTEECKVVPVAEQMDN